MIRPAASQMSRASQPILIIDVQKLLIELISVLILPQYNSCALSDLIIKIWSASFKDFFLKHPKREYKYKYNIN